MTLALTPNLVFPVVLVWLWTVLMMSFPSGQPVGSCRSSNGLIDCDANLSLTPHMRCRVQRSKTFLKEHTMRQPRFSQLRNLTRWLLSRSTSDQSSSSGHQKMKICRLQSPSVTFNHHQPLSRMPTDALQWTRLLQR